MNLIDGLNKSQREALLVNKGPLLVLAGAGSGKTRVITSKIAYLLENGLKPENILAITFTNKAAKEMRERVKKIVKGNLRGLNMSTFHSLGLSILKKEIHHLGYHPQFSIFGSSDQEGILKEIYQELKVNEEEFPVGFCSYLISQAKNRIELPEDVRDTHGNFLEIYKRYQQKLKIQNALDFDDLILLPLILFKRNSEIKKTWSLKYEYILVDEYQDTNYSQAVLLKNLSSEHGNICAVGDDDQSIYRFRGASVENILNFPKDFKNSKLVVLDKNYRNSPLILDSAYQVISNNKDRHPKNVESVYDETRSVEPIVCYEAEDVEDEANFIAQQIFDYRLSKKIPYKNQAVLCRTNAQMRFLEKGLRLQNIPYRIIGGYSFFDRSEVKTTLAYLRLLYNEKDIQSFYRVVQFPKRGIGGKTLEILSEYALENKISMMAAASRASLITGLTKASAYKLEEFIKEIRDFQTSVENVQLSSMIDQLYKTFHFREELVKIYKEEAKHRLASLDEMVSMVLTSENTHREEDGEGYSLESFLKDMLLSSLKDDDDDSEENKTLLITIHSAKGLEYDVVFIPGFEEGVFPHERSLKEGEAGIEEERRLCYVAFTRARHQLVLTFARTRKIKGTETMRSPARFLHEIPEKNLEMLDTKKEEELFQKNDGHLDFLEQMKNSFE